MDSARTLTVVGVALPAALVLTLVVALLTTRSGSMEPLDLSPASAL
ncbi:hypothetical protein [uncultured Friedmanniella sp.]